MKLSEKHTLMKAELENSNHELPYLDKKENYV